MSDSKTQARAEMNRWLREKPQAKAGVASYVRLLQAGNPLIKKDFQARVRATLTRKSSATPASSKRETP